jgi:uncharacterized cupin superfamily protein
MFHEGHAASSANRSEENPMNVVDLHSHPTVATKEGRWQPLNGALGLTAFGANAIELEPGEEFEIEHSETDSGQQELFAVIAGRMAVTVDGKTIEAGPGTVVGIPEISAVRSYRALEPGTRMLCIGGVPTAENAGFGEWITG